MPKVRVRVERQAGMRTPQLQNLRQALDGVDDALAGLLVARQRLSRRAMVLKARLGVPALDADRERQITSRYDRVSRGLGAVARTILKWCRHET